VGATTANVIPDVLKVSTGNQLWLIDITGGVPATDRILTFTDTLATAAAIPALTGPANEAVIPVNGQTGVAYNQTLSWAPASLASGYQVQIAYDTTFLQLAVPTMNLAFAQGVIPGLPVNWVVGPTAVAPGIINYQPGQTFYWRVRTSVPFFSQWSEMRSFNVQSLAAVAPSFPHR